MRERSRVGWRLTLGLAALALLGSAAAWSAHTTRLRPEAPSVETDPCFRYGRLECCIREPDT